MRARHRDGLLALFATAALVTVASWRTHLRTLGRPVPLVVGAAGALALELIMAWYPERSAALWAKRRVQALSTVGVVMVALAATFVAPWLLAVLFGGLLTYFVLLGLVLTGFVPGAEAWFER